MPTTPTSPAADAVDDLADLLRLAERAALRAQGALEGDAGRIAGRLFEQIGYLKSVAQLLRHEAARRGTAGGDPNRELRERLARIGG